MLWRNTEGIVIDNSIFVYKMLWMDKREAIFKQIELAVASLQKYGV
jgi:hypothetical protein